MGTFGPGWSANAADLAQALLVGAHRDVVVALFVMIPLLGWFLIIPRGHFGARWHRWLLTAGLFCFWVGQVYLLFAEYYFFEEFRSRFNPVAVDYLIYPHEVFVNIWDSYPVVKIWGTCVVVSAVWVWVARKLFAPMWEAVVLLRSRALHLAGAVALAAVLWPTVSLKPPRFSAERTLNEVANNGVIAFIAAAVTWNLDYAAFYRTIPKEEAYQRVRRMLTEPYAKFEDSQSLRRRITGDAGRPKLNVVVILVESFGSEFWGSLGRKKTTLTPEMDKLAAEEGVLFTNLYASGNRTVRGFEGVLSSFPPLPGDSIVKRDKSENVESIARVLKRDGYNTIFLYGGRGLFDGMRSYALANGYDRFVEQKHFEHPTFATAWGVCDEDLMRRSIAEFRELAGKGRPFFGTLLTVSNHKPYTYPPGRIPDNPKEQKRSHAVKYTDYCLGQFFKAARQEPFWTNTVFAVVADHGARVYGSQTIPIHSYEIPLLVVGPAVVKSPSRIPFLGSQIDVAPTILGLVGRPYESMFFGRDLFKSDPADARIVMHHNRDIGMFAHDQMVVLGLRQTEEFLAGNPKADGLSRLENPAPGQMELERDTIALYEVADDLYVNRQYRIDR